MSETRNLNLVSHTSRKVLGKCLVEEKGVVEGMCLFWQRTGGEAETLRGKDDLGKSVSASKSLSLNSVLNPKQRVTMRFC